MLESPSIFSNLRPRASIQGLVVCLVLWVPLISGGLQFIFNGLDDFGHRWLISAAIGDTVCFCCFGGTLVLTRLARAFMDWRHIKRDGPKRGAAFYLGISALIMPCVLPLGLLVGTHVARCIHRSYHPSIDSYRVGLGFGALMVALFFLQWARSEARDRVRDLENANLKAQLAALTAEMNPHMLFNALNTIASLIHSNPDRAEETVIELAEVYRGVLRAAKSGTTHSLADEIRLCEAYLRVEGARFGDRLRVSINVDADIDAKAVHVPMLVLQPLVENAIKHGIAPRASGGEITVRVRATGDASISVSVEDDGIGLGKSTVDDGNGRALANCKERLRLVYGDNASLNIAAREEGGTRALLLLPRTTSVSSSSSSSS